MSRPPKPLVIEGIELPEGYRFAPTEIELMEFYLNRKLQNPTYSCQMIAEKNVYDHLPWVLIEQTPSMGIDARYFFTSRKRKYQGGDRPDRAAGGGFWRATGTNTPIFDERKRDERKKELGYKQRLVFHTGPGTPCKENKTNWIMHEYCNKNHQIAKNSRENVMELDDWVLCKIYYNTRATATAENDEVPQLCTDGQASAQNKKRARGRGTTTAASDEVPQELCTEGQAQAQNKKRDRGQGQVKGKPKTTQGMLLEVPREVQGSSISELLMGKVTSTEEQGHGYSTCVKRAEVKTELYNSVAPDLVPGNSTSELLMGKVTSTEEQGQGYSTKLDNGMAQDLDFLLHYGRDKFVNLGRKEHDMYHCPLSLDFTDKFPLVICSNQYCNTLHTRGNFGGYLDLLENGNGSEDDLLSPDSSLLKDDPYILNIANNLFSGPSLQGNFGSYLDLLENGNGSEDDLLSPDSSFLKDDPYKLNIANNLFSDSSLQAYGSSNAKSSNNSAEFVATSQANSGSVDSSVGISNTASWMCLTYKKDYCDQLGFTSHSNANSSSHGGEFGDIPQANNGSVESSARIYNSSSWMRLTDKKGYRKQLGFPLV